MVHIRRFYDQVLRRRGNKNEDVSKSVSDQRELTKFVQDAFDELNAAKNDDVRLAYCIVNFGYVIFAEWMHDLFGADGSSCKQKIISLFEAFLKSSEDPARAERLLNGAWENTKVNAPLFQSSVWEDWEETCSNIVELSRP